MRIAIVGYGKMGKTIEQIAKDRGNEISYIIDANNQEELANITPENTDVAIEFTRPESGFQNIQTLISNGVKVVSGTTGWLERKPEIEALTKEKDGAFFYASNFSVGVNIFFKLNKILAKIMNNFKDYDVDMEEIHHIHKLDAPSGTAITLAEGVYENLDRKSNWKLDNIETAEKNFKLDVPNGTTLSLAEGGYESLEDKSGKTLENAKGDQDIAIYVKRENEVPGTHLIDYRSQVDTIEIKHTAHTRQGFALGAVVAAEWLKNQKGVVSMDDMLAI